MNVQKLQNMLRNPGFEDGLFGWKFPKEAVIEVRPGYTGQSAVLVGNVLNEQVTLRQLFLDVPPNTTFHFSAMLKTVDVQYLEVHFLYRDIYDAERNWYGGKAGVITGSKDWRLYETTFVTPNVVTSVGVFPAVMFNRGEVWIDNAYLGQIPSVLRRVTLDSSPVKVAFNQPIGQAPFTIDIADGGKITVEVPPSVEV